jgi:hypothetical protein
MNCTKKSKRGLIARLTARYVANQDSCHVDDAADSR